MRITGKSTANHQRDKYMNAESSVPGRVLLVLDACAERADLLEKAVQLACALDSELSVRYVEDERLLQSASLPFARETMAVTSSLRAISYDRIRFSYRSETTQIMNRLRRLAEERGIRWTFESVQNHLSLVQPGSDGENDLILTEAKRYDYLSSGLSSVFISRISRDQVNPVVVLFDASPDSQRCLVIAAKLAEYYQSGLYILVPAATDEQYGVLLKGIDEIYLKAGGTLITRIAGVSCADVGKAMRWKQGGLLVLSSTIQPGARDMRELTNSLHMQVLVIRGRVA